MKILSTILLVALSQHVFGSALLSDTEPVASDKSSQCSAMAGIPGIPGFPGPAGSSGSPGPAGSKGESGLTGSSGPQGPLGPSGEPGQPGEVGPPGPRSVAGKVGPVGPSGSRGPNGKTGPRGMKGAKGRVGVSGASGVKGQKGAGGQARHSSFTVTKTETQQGTRGVILMFDNIVTNIGENFSTSQGKFTCEIPGAYVFSFTVMVASGTAGVSMINNGVNVVGTYIRNSKSYINQASGTAVLQLNTGDQVWTEFSHDGSIYSESYKFTSFTGYLLYEM